MRKRKREREREHILSIENTQYVPVCAVEKTQYVPWSRAGGRGKRSKVCCKEWGLIWRAERWERGGWAGMGRRWEKLWRREVGEELKRGASRVRGWSRGGARRVRSGGGDVGRYSDFRYLDRYFRYLDRWILRSRRSVMSRSRPGPWCWTVTSRRR